MTEPSAPRDPSDPHRDLAGVLHDVSNALTVLLGWVGEARSANESRATPEEIDYALTIIEQRARIARDLARHAIGAPRIDEQRNVGAVVKEVADALRVEAQTCSARIVVHGEDASAKVAGALDVSQVVTNIVLNALAHAPKDSVVDVRVHFDDERCAILVDDEGPGIPVDRRDAVFRGDSARPGGTGVGLRHSRALARAWGGDVELAPSGAGARGARFRVTWPRVDAVPRPPLSARDARDAADAPSARGQAGLAGMRVLVVEDDLAVTQLLEAALDARGADVTICTSDVELAAALGGAAASPFDAALVDLSPIADDPASALTRIRRALGADAPLLLITGNADALPDAAFAASVELVRKPFEVREVVAAIQKKRLDAKEKAD